MKELYCRTDQACICALCFKIDHKGHSVVALEEEYEAVMAKKDETIENIQKMIESRAEKKAEIERSVDVSRREAEEEKEASVQVFTDWICSIQRSQAELVEVIEERYRAMKQKAEGLLTELKMEVGELERRSSQLEQLSQSEDHHRFVQSFPTLCSPLNTDWSNIDVHTDLYIANTTLAINIKLKEKLQKVGIFVDYEEGVVSFYDVDSKSHIYSFTGQHFTEQYYQYFFHGGNMGGTNSAPLIITPVPKTQ